MRRLTQSNSCDVVQVERNADIRTRRSGVNRQSANRGTLSYVQQALYVLTHTASRDQHAMVLVRLRLHRGITLAVSATLAALTLVTSPAAGQDRKSVV